MIFSSQCDFSEAEFLSIADSFFSEYKACDFVLSSLNARKESCWEQLNFLRKESMRFNDTILLLNSTIQNYAEICHIKRECQAFLEKDWGDKRINEFLLYHYKEGYSISVCSRLLKMKFEKKVSDKALIPLKKKILLQFDLPDWYIEKFRRVD